MLVCHHDTPRVHPNVYQYTGTNAGKALPAHAWPGGYPLYYLDGDGCILCAPCATRASEYSSCTIAADVHWEGDALTCEQCNESIESAYGEID